MYYVDMSKEKYPSETQYQNHYSCRGRQGSLNKPFNTSMFMYLFEFNCLSTTERLKAGAEFEISSFLFYTTPHLLLLNVKYIYIVSIAYALPTLQDLHPIAVT